MEINKVNLSVLERCSFPHPDSCGSAWFTQELLCSAAPSTVSLRRFNGPAVFCFMSSTSTFITTDRVDEKQQ